MARYLLVVFSLLFALVWANTPVELSFAEMYTEMYAEAGSTLEFSQTLKAAEGQTVKLKGYAAPPLKPNQDFFVLTRYPVSVCPFCEDETQWPPDIVFIRLPPNGFNEIIFGGFEVTGTLELGPATDPGTGFVSRVRIIADKVERP